MNPALKMGEIDAFIFLDVHFSESKIKSLIKQVKVDVEKLKQKY